MGTGGCLECAQGLKALGAFKPGKWSIIDGWLFEKTLNLSHNALSGALPVWALQALAAGEGLTVKLEVRRSPALPSYSTAGLLWTMRCDMHAACRSAMSYCTVVATAVTNDGRGGQR